MWITLSTNECKTSLLGVWKCSLCRTKSSPSQKRISSCKLLFDTYKKLDSNQQSGIFKSLRETHTHTRTPEFSYTNAFQIILTKKGRSARRLIQLVGSYFGPVTVSKHYIITDHRKQEGNHHKGMHRGNDDETCPHLEVVDAENLAVGET